MPKRAVSALLQDAGRRLHVSPRKHVLGFVLPGWLSYDRRELTGGCELAGDQNMGEKYACIQILIGIFVFTCPSQVTINLQKHSPYVQGWISKMG